MNKRHSEAEGMNMPATLKASLGRPPLLKFEDARAYDALMAQVTASIVPTDTIEWLLVTDIVDATWEIRRYRRFKMALIDSEIKTQLTSALALPDVSQTVTEIEKLTWGTTVTRRRSEEELKDLKERRESLIEDRRASPYFADEPRDYSAIYARAFMNRIENVNKIEALLLSAERRRDVALSKLDQYRARGGASRQPASSKVIDADFQDLSAANAPRKLKKSA